MRLVIIPRDNAKDLKEVPEEILDSLSIELVRHVDEVLPLALAAEREEIFPGTDDGIALTQSLRLGSVFGAASSGSRRALRLRSVVRSLRTRPARGV